MILDEYRFYYEKLISMSEHYIEKYGVFSGSEDKAKKHERDIRLLRDYRFFALSKGTKSLKAFYSLLEQGFYEDAIILTRTIYECYLSNRYFEDQFDLRLQDDMVTVPVGLMRGKYVDNVNTVLNKEDGEIIDYTRHEPSSLVLGKDKGVFYPLYNYMCSMAHCNFSQCSIYVDNDYHFYLSDTQNETVAHLIGLYTFSKLFESTLLLEGMPFEKGEEELYEDLLEELTIFLYERFDNADSIPVPDSVSDKIIREIFRLMKNSLKEQLGRTDKSFVNLLEKQKKVSNRERELRKALLESEKPSEYFGNVKDMSNAINLFPELIHIIGVKDDKITGDDRDYWDLTMELIDRAAILRDRAKSPYGFMLMALSYNIPRAYAVTSALKDGSRTPEEVAAEGLKLIEKFLDRITAHYMSKRYVAKMTPCYVRYAGAASDKRPEEELEQICSDVLWPEDIALFAQAADL